MKKYLLLLAVLAANCVMLFAQQEQMMLQPLPVDPGTRMGKLPNGLTYYLRHNEYPKGEANFYIAQKVGSVLEEEDQRGLAHFLEHMCFNGTDNFPGNSLVKYLEGIGVKFGQQLNAYTSVDETVYNINHVPTANEATIDSVLLILHDWSHNLTLDPEEIDKERGVIHEEWRMRSSATLRIYERQLPKLMSNSRAGNRLPIGTMEVIDNFKPEALRAYYEKWYRPDLQAIIVVGDLDIDRVEQQLQKMFSDIDMPVNPAERIYYSVDDNAEPIVVSDHDKEQTVTVVTISNKHEKLVPREHNGSILYLIVSLMKNAVCSMLNERLEEKALDPEAPFVMGQVDDGNFLLSNTKSALETTIVPKEGQIDAAIQSVMAEVYRAGKFGFTQGEYDRWKAEFMSQLESMYENKDKRRHDNYIQECVRHFIDGDAMPGLEMEYAFYKQVLPMQPLEAINGALADLISLNDSNLVILCMNPEKEDFVQPTEEQLLAAVHAAQQMELTPYEDNVKNEPLIPVLPKQGKIKKEKDGKFGTKVLTLSNGVTVIAKPTDFKDNEILMRAYSDGGSGRYPDSDKYTLDMYDELIGASGLGNFTAMELSKALAGVQASVSTGLTTRSETMSGNAVPKDFRTMFELIYLSFQKPYRDDKAVASLMQSTAESLRNQAANPMKAFGDTLAITRYGNHPRLVLMKEEDLTKVSYDRALEIYADRFADASDFTFVFVGNIDMDSLRLYCKQYLATLPVVKRKDTPVDCKFNALDGVRENVFRQQMEQPSCTYLTLLTAPTKKTMEADLAGSIFGQVLTMRLLETVREEMGAAYSVGAGCGISRRTDGNYEYITQIYAPLKPEMCDTVRMVIKQETESIVNNGIGEEYLSKVKEYLLKTYKDAERQNGTWFGYIEQYYREGGDFYTDFEKAVQAVTSDDIRKVAREIVEAGNRTTVIMLPKE